MLVYKLPGNAQRLIFTDSVLQYFQAHRQIYHKQKEAGGQLFARITKDCVIISAATGPHKKDYRRRFYFFPDLRRLKSEITKYFERNLHYVGDWHTHPQKKPVPSQLDIESMKLCFTKSKHELEHFLLVIVGQKTEYENLWVGAVNNRGVIDLSNYF